MNLPGFTAESALHLNGNYRAMTGPSTGFRNLRGVVPQLPIGFCQANCDAIGDPFLSSVCRLNCLGSNGAGGGGGGRRPPLCVPQCGRCLPNEDSPTGRSKFCILRNCNDVDRPC
jgi:hypothetical protein